MSMSPQQMERKLSQLDNDVQSIYEMLNGISTTQVRHSNRFKELAEQVGGLEIRLDRLEAKVDSHDARFDGIDAKIDTVLELLRAR
jgi:chaperonin cofactor prefoldin